MSKKIRLTVAGIEYYVNTDESEAYMREIANKVDVQMTSLSKGNPFLSTTMAAVMCALQFCDENKKLETELAETKRALKRSTEESACSSLESDEARREIERLNRENMRLRDKLSGR
ncbi:MAG: cell division protein ZapA [Clostridia bacterium]|nr:cell division protein ZapA [Clostridia bacterium]